MSQYLSEMLKTMQPSIVLTCLKVKIHSASMGLKDK